MDEAKFKEVISQAPRCENCQTAHYVWDGVCFKCKEKAEGDIEKVTRMMP